MQPDPKAQYRSVYEALKKIVLTEGFWRPLRGINVTMLGAGPAHAMYFACYEKMKKSLSDIIQHGGNSHLANGISGICTTPPSPLLAVNSLSLACFTRLAWHPSLCSAPGRAAVGSMCSNSHRKYPCARMDARCTRNPRLAGLGTCPLAERFMLL